MEGNRQGIFSVETNALLVATPTERAAIAVRPREINTLDTDAFIDTSVASIWQRGQAKLREVKAAIERSRGCIVPLPVFVRAVHQAAAEGKIALPENASALANTEMLDLCVLPKKMRIAAEAKLNLWALNDLPQAALQITQIAPEMNFEFVVTIGAEGDTLSPEQIRELNEVLTKVSPNLRLA
jgi:hypothetical protein